MMEGNSESLEVGVIEHERCSLSGMKVEILVRVVESKRCIMTVNKQRMGDDIRGRNIHTV